MVNTVRIFFEDRVSLFVCSLVKIRKQESYLRHFIAVSFILVIIATLASLNYLFLRGGSAQYCSFRLLHLLIALIILVGKVNGIASGQCRTLFFTHCFSFLCLWVYIVTFVFPIEMYDLSLFKMASCTGEECLTPKGLEKLDVKWAETPPQHKRAIVAGIASGSSSIVGALPPGPHTPWLVGGIAMGVAVAEALMKR